MSLQGSTLAHRRWLMSYEAAATREVAAAADKRLTPLFRRLQRLDEQLSKGRPLTARQRAQAQRDRARLLRTIRTARTDAQEALQGRMQRAILTERNVSVRNLTAALPEGRTARAPAIDLQTLLLNPTAGRSWTGRLDANMVQTYNRLDAALLVAVDRGASMPRATELVRLAVGEEAGLGHRLGRLVRTEIQRVSNEAAQATYAANRDVVGAVRYLSTLDARACAVCRPLHRRVYPLDELGGHAGPTIPQHPGCRCFFAPVTRSLAEILAAA